jgi:DNA topoisomerase-1
MSRSLLIVESPTKAKKISKFLGPAWDVRASVGHVRDLPQRELGVDRGNAFGIAYEIIEGKKKTIADLRAASKAAAAVYLATDPDREGEAIAWHLEVVLGLRNPKRVTFDEITKGEILTKIEQPRVIDYALVHAQEARRALDRLVGYEVSGALRRKTGTSQSAGRVQTIGVRLVVDREEEIAAFVSRDHYGVTLTFAGDSPWTADWAFKPYLPEGEKLWIDRDVAEQVARVRNVRVVKREEKESRSAPPAPFTTSTLLQAAANRLRIASERGAALAQSLFEKGLITYHRTDSPNLSDEAVANIRDYAKTNSLALPDVKRTWKAKDAAQGAHEAIRPTDVFLVDARQHPEADHRATDEEQRLYELIRLRAIASQLAEAVYDVRVLALEAADERLNGRPIHFIARGRTLRIPGFKALTADDATEDAKDDPEARNPVPRLNEGTALTATSGRLVEKKTEPPSRYTEASLVKALEDRGVGRPSTYATILKTIKARAYVEERKDRKFYPTDSGVSLIRALRGRFSFVEVDFTSRLEGRLDEIAEGRANYASVVGTADATLQSELTAFADVKVEGMEAVSGGACPVCTQGMLLRRVRRAPAVKGRGKGKNDGGVFWSCNRYPECTAIYNDAGGKPDLTPRAPRVEGGTCPVCTKNPLVRRENDRGVWWGCSGWKSDGCKGSFPDLDGKPNLDAPRPVAEEGPKCPKCKKAKLRKRSGARGAFWGCSGYPKCKATFEDADGTPQLDRSAA